MTNQSGWPGRAAALLKSAGGPVGVALALLAAVVAPPSRAQAPSQGQVQTAVQAPNAEPALQEIQVAPEAFERGAALPAWAELAAVPPADPALAGKPLVVRLADSQLWVGPPSAYLVNRVEQANDASALAGIGQPQIAFNPQYQRLRLHRVAILRGEQVIEHTAGVQVRFLQREAGLEQGIYSGIITAALVLPDVRVGDALQLVYTLEGDNPIFGTRYGVSSGWDQPQPTQWRRITLTHPAGRDLHWRWVGGEGDAPPAPTVDERDGRRRLRFEARNLPATEIEPMLPSGALPARWLQVSEYGSWAEVAAWARGLFPADAPLPPAALAEVERLRALPDAGMRASGALQWVQREIRYYSVTLGESSHRPALPAEVVERRYGDCKDKTLLLTQMLRALGLDAGPALASLEMRQGVRQLLPSPLAFDHAVVRLRLAGRDHVLDPTRLGQAGPLDRLGQHLEDTPILPVDADALLTVASPNRGEIFRSELSEHFALAAFDAEGTLETEQVWSGLQAEALRQVLPGLDAAQRGQWALSQYERRYPGIRLVGTPEFVDDAAGNRVTARSRYRIPQLARLHDAGWSVPYFPVNFQGTFSVPDVVSGRRFPVGVPSWPATLVYRFEMTWPTSVSVVADPSTRHHQTAFYDVETRHSFRGNVLRHAVELQPRLSAVPAAELPSLMTELRTLEQMVGSLAIVAKAAVKSDGVLGLGRTTMQDQMRRRLQATVDRAGKVIDAGLLQGEDLAEALCARAEAHADLGEADEGLPDAERAVQAAPQFARALECRASLHWSLGDFAAAAADYSQALAVAEDPFEPIYRRGQARFYEGKLAQAATDFAKAVAHEKDSAARLYKQLWQAMALRRQGLPLPAEIQQPDDAAAAWPRPAMAMLAGRLSADDLIARITAQSQGDERELALAEAWFYVGQHHLAEGRRDAARQAFEAARAKGVTMYVEHVAAGFELQQLAP